MTNLYSLRCAATGADIAFISALKVNLRLLHITVNYVLICISLYQS